jgi:hypothetical protein
LRWLLSRLPIDLDKAKRICDQPQNDKIRVCQTVQCDDEGMFEPKSLVIRFDKKGNNQNETTSSVGLESNLEKKGNVAISTLNSIVSAVCFN